MRRHILAALAALVPLSVVLLPASPASAHPLGNFSVNQYLGLTIHADHVSARAVVDVAEIPTLQNRPAVDASGDGTVTDAERSAYATRTCAEFAGAVGGSLTWTVLNGDFTYASGAGGLDVSRLVCSLTAPLETQRSMVVSVDNRYLADRVGWRELTAVGDGVRLVDSPLPAASVSGELTTYPKDLLSSPLDLRSAQIRVEPGTGDGAPGASSGNASVAAATLGAGSDPVSRWMAAVDRRFQDLAGGPHLTPLVGLLAVGLALLLGAGHAALPGHGKTVLAAYLAGRRGRPRDALTVAGTVTLTHTGGVLILGLLLTAGTAIAGDTILSWLGLISGTVVLIVGVTMLLPHLRRLRSPARAATPHAHHAHSGHPPAAHVRHDHGHDHGHDGGHGHASGHGHAHGHDHGQTSEHRHASGHGHAHGLEGARGRGRWGLAGVGVAGGLVPSPSALVVLLAAIGLGRTEFGILLVVAYGAGMALTLTGAGLLLLAVQRRMSGRTPWPWLSRVTARLNAATPVATAGLVLLVGAGLAVRAAAAVL